MRYVIVLPSSCATDVSYNPEEFFKVSSNFFTAFSLADCSFLTSRLASTIALVDSDWNLLCPLIGRRLEFLQ